MLLIILFQETDLPEWWPFVVSLATLILTWIGGMYSVPIITWLKRKLNLSGRWVYVLVGVFSFVIAILGMVIDGILAPGAVDWQNAGWLLTTAIVASQVEYRRIKDAGGFDAPALEG